MKSAEDEYSEGFRRMISDVTDKDEPKPFFLHEPHESSIVKPVFSLRYIDESET